MRKLWGLTIVLLAASVASSADPPAAQRSVIPRAPEFVQRVNTAIDRGVEWLRKHQAADGSFPDYSGHPGAATALAYHTLRVCGVPRDDPAAVKAYDALRDGYRRTTLATYTATLYLMAIESHGDRVDKATDDRDVRLAADDRKWADEIARCLAGGQHADGAWSYGVDLNPDLRGSGAGPGSGDVGGNSYDHSNTQYALLGLKSAARCGVPIDPVIWTRSLDHFLVGQEPSGPAVRRRAGAAKTKGATAASVSDRARGWGYAGGGGRGTAYASMTAAGVSSVVICRSELLGTRSMTPQRDRESEQSVWDGLAWLGTNWGATVLGDGRMRGVQLPGFVNHYEYYGVERAGVLAGVEWMADADWYGAGAAPLLESQQADGSWVGTYGARVAGRRAKGAPNAPIDVIDTCFALLFLKKGTTPVRRGGVVRTMEGTDLNFDAAAALGARDFEDFLDSVLGRWRRASDDGLKESLFAGATSVGPRIVEPLLVRLDAEDLADRFAAHALLRRATGLDFGFVPGAAPEARDAAALKWQTWWMTSKDRIVYDPAAGRLVVR